MSSKGDQDIDIDVALCNAMDSDLNRYIEGLSGTIIYLNRKKEELDDVKKRLNEISIQFHDCKKKDEAEILKESLNVLIAEFYKIKESIDLDLDLEVHRGTGGTGREEGCKVDDVKTGTEFNQSCESSCTERNRKDVFDMASDSTETEKESQEIQKQGDVKKRFLDNVAKSDSSDDTDEQPVSADNEGISTNIEGLEQDLLDTIRDLKVDK